MIDNSGFRKFLKTRYEGRVPSNIISRVGRLELLMGCDFNKEWEKDKMESVLNRFDDYKWVRNVLNLPIGSNQLNIYKHSLRRYIEYKNSLT